MSIPFTYQVTTAANVLVREVDGEAVLLNLNNKSYFGLDEISTHMWGVLTRSASIQEAYDILLTDYDVSPQELSSDLHEFIAHLRQSGLINVTAP